MKIVVVSPHRDDAAFSLGLAIDSWLAAGHRVTVLNCFTQSEYAPFSDVASLHPHDRLSFATAVRRREDVAWQKLVRGRFEFQDLDLLDAPQRLACSADEVLTVEIRLGDRAVSRLGGALAKMIRTAPPDGIALAVPLAVGGHIDHRVARAAALEAGKLPTVPLAFYEDLPYAARPGAAETVPTLAETTGMELQPCFAAAADADAGAAVRRKTRLSECYDSQVDSEQVGSIAEFCRAYGGRERLWANQAWQQTGLCVESAS